MRWMLAASILQRVRKQGDKAVVAAAKKFDGSRMTAQTMRVRQRFKRKTVSR